MATHPTALGKIAVATPGTAVQISATDIGCAKIRFEAPISNTHTIWIGTAALVGSTLTAAIAELAPGAAVEMEDQNQSNTLHLNDYWTDATTAAEGPLVTYWTA
jgi:hypothetical protein